MHISIRRTFVCAIIRSVRNVAYLPSLAHHPLCSFIHLLLTLKWTLLPHTKNTTTLYACVSVFVYPCVPTFYYNIFSSTYSTRPYTYISWHIHPQSKQPLSTQRIPHHLRVSCTCEFRIRLCGSKTKCMKIGICSPLSIHFNSSSRACVTKDIGNDGVAVGIQKWKIGSVWVNSNTPYRQF